MGSSLGLYKSSKLWKYSLKSKIYAIFHTFQSQWAKLGVFVEPILALRPYRSIINFTGSKFWSSQQGDNSRKVACLCPNVCIHSPSRMTNQKAQVSHALTLDSLLDHSLYIKVGHGHRGYSPIMKPRVRFAAAVWVFRNQMWGVSDTSEPHC